MVIQNNLQYPSGFHASSSRTYTELQKSKPKFGNPQKWKTYVYRQSGKDEKDPTRTARWGNRKCKKEQFFLGEKQSWMTERRRESVEEAIAARVHFPNNSYYNNIYSLLKNPDWNLKNLDRRARFQESKKNRHIYQNLIPGTDSKAEDPPPAPLVNLSFCFFFFSPLKSGLEYKELVTGHECCDCRRERCMRWAAKVDFLKVWIQDLRGKHGGYCSNPVGLAQSSMWADTIQSNP